MNDQAKAYEECPPNAQRLLDAFAIIGNQGDAAVESVTWDEETGTVIIKSKRNSLGRIRITVAMEGE